jgi:deoxycytidylate deaminase
MMFTTDHKFTHEETRKWFKLAKAVMDVESPCHSRQIGVVIVDPETNSLVSSGHNGPPQGCPRNDDPNYLRSVVWPQLTDEEKRIALPDWSDVAPSGYEIPDSERFVNRYGNCGVCPRKHINAPSGKRLELCTCIHGEVDAITRANRSVAGCYMFCYCGVPCIECTKVIINSGLDIVMAIDHGRGDYSPYSSRWLFEKSAVRLVLVKEDWINLM